MLHGFPAECKLCRGIQQPNKIMEYQVGREHKVHLFQPFLAKAQSRHDDPFQLNLKVVQCWGIHCFPGEIIPMANCFHGKKFSSCIQLESLQK